MIAFDVPDIFTSRYGTYLNAQFFDTKDQSALSDSFIAIVDSVDCSPVVDPDPVCESILLDGATIGDTLISLS
jgi:hypothetical protein